MSAIRVHGDAYHGDVLEINSPKFLIGRATDCNFRPVSLGVSRYHCAILTDGEELLVRDLGSSNGTYVNGTRATGVVVVQPGDVITAGPLQLEVLADAQAVASSPEDEVAGWLMGGDAPDTHIMTADDFANAFNNSSAPPPRPAAETQQPAMSASEAAAQTLFRSVRKKG